MAKPTDDEATDLAQHIFDNHYDGPSDPQSFNKALLQVFLHGMQTGIDFVQAGSSACAQKTEKCRACEGTGAVPHTNYVATCETCGGTGKLPSTVSQPAAGTGDAD